MPPAPAPASSSRVLAFYPHRRTTGRVAFDGFGLVPGSFTAFELRRFAPDLGERLDVIVERSVRRFRPALVVVGVTNPRSALAERVVSRAAALGVKTLAINLEDAKRALFRPAPGGFDKVAQVVCSFLPELAKHAHPEGTISAIEIRRRLSPAWTAAAAGLVALCDAAPFSAAALLRGDLPPGSQIHSLIAAAARRTDPERAL